MIPQEYIDELMTGGPAPARQPDAQEYIDRLISGDPEEARRMILLVRYCRCEPIRPRLLT